MRNSARRTREGPPTRRGPVLSVGWTAGAVLLGWTGDFADPYNFLGTWFAAESTEWGFNNPEVFDVSPTAPRVTLDLSPAARWVVETYPVEKMVERPDGGVEARLAVASRAWLERLLLRLGDEVQVIDADDPELATAGADAARRVLERYRAGRR